MFVLGVAYARKGDPTRAADMLNRVLDAEPRSYETLISLSTVYRDCGNLVDAIDLGLRAVQVRPDQAHAYNHLGRCYLSARRLSEAADAFTRAAQLQPGVAAAFYNLGKTRQLEGKDGEAADAFGRAVGLSPTLENHLAFGQSLLNLCDFDGALACAERCVDLYETSAAAHLLLCGALTELNRIPEAESHLQRAVELDKDGKEALQIAARQRPLGHVEEANDNLRRAIELNPLQITAYDALMHNQRVTEKDRPLVGKMRTLLEQKGLAPTELVSVHYGLGKALEDLGEYEESMRHYDEANRLSRQLKFGDVGFDEARYAQRIGQMIEAFPSRGPLSNPASSSLPVLIVGMMRSGTTLAEQILSSHPEVEPAGEQLFWSRNWMRALPDGQQSLNEEVASTLGNEYFQLLREIGPHAARVTDKMPGNYMFAGFIHLALPNARIIHMRRLPIDTCLSIWATPNHMPHEGGNQKAGIAFVYKQYLRLMEHWRGILPSDRFLEIDYEELVSDRERLTRSMVEFCGLEWDEACLHPERNDRTVLTPSAWQVRQPVYRTSVERWRRFESCLGEFEELIDLHHPSMAAIR